jgi:serine/threonine protein kinase
MWAQVEVSVEAACSGVECLSRAGETHPPSLLSCALSLRDSSLNHPNIVQYLGTCCAKLCIVLEYLPLGTVMDFLLSSHCPLRTELLLGLASDSAEGLRYMHDRGFIHRDFKSENLLLVSTDPSADVLCKLADFGESRHISATMSRRHIGTPRWTSPEVFAGEPYNEKADLFSYGMVLWEMCHREIPFSEVRRDSHVEDMIIAGGRPVIKDHGRLLLLLLFLSSSLCVCVCVCVCGWVGGWVGVDMYVGVWISV